GVPLWTNRYNGPGNADDKPKAIATDKDANVFVTGSSAGPGSSVDFATIAYSSTGVPLWTNRYNSPANGGDYATAIAVDGLGNVFVTGPSAGQGIVTLAYSAAGVPLWTNAYQNGYNAYAIAVDAAGNVFVNGQSQASDLLTVGYSNSGVLLWTNTYDG